MTALGCNVTGDTERFVGRAHEPDVVIALIASELAQEQIGVGVGDQQDDRVHPLRCLLSGRRPCLLHRYPSLEGGVAALCPSFGLQDGWFDSVQMGCPVPAVRCSES